MRTITLYRPIGQREYEKLEGSGFTEWPPRLPEQPIFYPVTNQAYAAQIARDWNTQDDLNGRVGYVTRFEVDADYLEQFPIKIVGGSEHSEYWIPAEKLDEFNSHLVGPIEIIEKYSVSGTEAEAADES